MHTADIAKSTQCWCERILSGRFSPLRSAPTQMIFFQHQLTAPLPLMPFSARSAPFSAPLTLRSRSAHMLCSSAVDESQKAAQPLVVIDEKQKFLCLLQLFMIRLECSNDL